MNAKDECRAALMALHEQTKDIALLRGKLMRATIEHALECLDKLTVARAPRAPKHEKEDL